MKRTKIAIILSIITLFAMNPLTIKAETEWSEWSDEEPSGIEKKYETEERTLYQYRDKSHTTSTKSSLSGWIQEKEPTTTWGSWSAWQDAKVTATSTRKVKTQQVIASYSYPTNPSPSGYEMPERVITYGCWGGGDVCWVQEFLVDCCGYNIAVDAKCGSETVEAIKKFQSAYGLTVDGMFGTESKNKALALWREKRKTPIYKTQYSYQDATITYYYYRWSDWSQWSETVPTANEDREINSKTQYRYRIIEQLMSDVKVSGINKTYTYTGKEIEPETVLMLDDNELVKDKDYTISYSNNVNAGTAMITYTGLGSYSGTLEYTYTISAKDIGNAVVDLSKDSYVYTGQEIIPEVIISLDGITLVQGKDYETSYSNNINVGTSDIQITGIGNYTGVVSTSFVIIDAPTTEAVIQPQSTSEETTQVQTTTEIQTTAEIQTTEVIQETASAGTVMLIAIDGQEENKIAAETGGTDSKVKIKKDSGKSSNGSSSSGKKIGKGTIFESDKATYKVSNVKKGSVIYVKSNAKKSSNVKVPDIIKYNNKTYKVTEIAPNAFKNNKKLTKLVIGKNVKKIGKNAFRGCKKLKSVTIGKNVEIIGAYAFYGDKKLNMIKFGTRKLNKVGKGAFKKISKHPTAKVPRERLQKYQKLIKKAI